MPACVALGLWVFWVENLPYVAVDPSSRSDQPFISKNLTRQLIGIPARRLPDGCYQFSASSKEQVCV